MRKYLEGKRIAAALLAIIVTLTSLPLSVFAGTSELLTNGNFKAGALDGWTTQGEVDTSSDGWISGDYAVLSGENGLASLQSDSVDAMAEKNYVISASVRISEGTIFKAQILQYSATGESAAGAIEIPVNVEKDKWDEFSYIFHTAADVSKIAVYLENSAGVVDVDNISVKPTSKYPVYSPEGTKVEIQNADFSDGLKDWDANGEVITTEGFNGHGVELQVGESLSQKGVKLESDSLYELHYYTKAVGADGCESSISLIYKDEKGETKTVIPYTLVGNSDAEGWKEITAQFETKYVSKDATLQLAVVSEQAVKGATVSFDEIVLTKIKSYSNGISKKTMLLAAVDEEVNLFTNGSFALNTNAVAYGTSNFAMKTGFSDEKLSWLPGDVECAKRFTWSVETGTEHGNALKISGKTGSAATNLQQTVAWQSGKTYEISFWLKTGSAAVERLQIIAGGATLWINNSENVVRKQVVSEWTKYSYELEAGSSHASNQWMRLNYWLTAENQTIYLADFKIVEKKAPAKRLDNGNFVDGTVSWTGFTDANVVDGTSNGAKSGKVLKVVAPTTIKHDAFTEPLVAGQKYTFKFRMRNNALSGAEIASVYFTSNNGRIMESKLSATNGVWKEYVLDYVAKAGDETPQLVIDLASAQGVEFTFADFSFAEYSPLLTNGDFSEDTKDWTVFWLNKDTAANEGYFDGIVNEGGEHGKVMKISKNALDTQITDLRHTALSGDNKLTVGQSYKLSFDIKTVGTYVSYSLQLRDGADGGTIVAYTGGSTSGEWKTIEYEYVATEGYQDLQVWVRANPLSATVSSVTDYYIDNVKVERLDKTVKGDSEIANSQYTIMNGTYPEFWGLLGESSDNVSATAGGNASAKLNEFYVAIFDGAQTNKNFLNGTEVGEWKKYSFDYTPTNANANIRFMYKLTSMFQTVYLADVQIRAKDGTGGNVFTNGSFALSNGVNYGQENFNMKTGFGDGKLYWPNTGGATANMTWSVIQDAEHGNVFKVSGSKMASGYWLWQDVSWEPGKTYTVSYWAKTGTSSEITQEANGYIDATNNSGTEVGASTLVPVYEGADYTLNFWLKANKTARENFKLRLTNYKDYTRTLIDGEAKINANVQLKDSDDWQLVSVPFSIEKGAGYMDISFLTTAPGAQFRLSGAEVILGEEAQKNASFEIGDIDSKPIGWSFSGAGTLTKQLGGVDGDYAGRISNGNTGHLTGANFEVEPGTYYEMSYWVKKDAPYDNIVYPYFKQLKEDGSSSTTANVSFPWTIRVYGSTNGEWKHVRYFFKTADDAAAVTFNLVVSGAFQEVWIDDAKIVKKDLIPNIDFEVADEDGNPEGWYLTDALDTDPEINVDTQYYHSGKQSVHLKVDSKIEEQKLVGAYRFPVNVEGDKRLFEHSFWVASRNANMKSVQLDLNFFDENGNSLVSGATRKGIRKTLNAGPEISEWSQVIVRSEIPRNAAYARLVFTFTQGTAELWIDDIFFDQVESDTEVVAAHNDFHAVDQNGKIEGWTAQGGTLVQKTDAVGGFSYGVLSGGTMSYTTDTLATEYQYKYTVRYKSDTHVNAAVRFYDYKRNEYTDLAVTKELPASAGWTTAEIEFTAASCTTCDLVLGSGGELSVSQVVLYQTAKPSTKPSWTGKWISYRPDYRWCTEYNSSYYRKKITLDAEVIKAPFQITGDDKFALWVNGKEVYNNINDATGTWAAIQVLDLKEYLKVGDNIIAIEVYNQGAYSALIYDGIWTLANGKTVECISNAETLCLDPEPVGDWKSYNYDDSQWSRSMVAGNVPINPWGDIYFDATLYIDNVIEVEPVEGEGVLVNDLEYEFSVKMKLKKQIDTQLPFNAVLWRRNSITSICTMPITLVDHQEMRNWPVGEWFTVKMKVELPDYIDDGNYTLQLSDEYFVIESEDVYDNKFISFKVVNDYLATERVSKIETINGVPTLTVDGAVGPQFWWLMSGTNPSSSLSTIGESDFEIYLAGGVAIGEGEGSSKLWSENGSFDYAKMDKNLNTVLAASQKTNVIVQIRLYAPSWWLEENPDEVALAVDSKGVETKQVAASFGSEKWKIQAGELLKDILTHMRQQKYYSRVAGIRLIAGGTDEFITYGTDVGIPDYSPAALEFFKKWAKEEYGTIENLREAWNDDTIESFDDIEFPTYAEMNADGGYGMMYNPETQQKCIDFSNLLGEMTTDSMLYWAQVAKEATDNKLVVGAYYGYLFSGFAESVAPTALYKVLNSPHIDFLCGPQGYNERQLGEAGTVQTVADTIRAYGKLCVNEQDNRTVLTNQFAGTVWDTDRAYSVGHTYTMQDSILALKRDTTYNIANGNASYTYDMQGGWFNEKQLFDLISDINDEYYFAGHLERDLMNDVALIIPDKNPAYIRHDNGKGAVNTVSNQTVLTLGMYNWHRKQLAQMGAGYDIYALSTLEEGKMPTHKINIFFSPFYLSDEQRGLIDQYCKNNGQINIFLYMSGLGADDGNSVENMKDLTGFDFEYNTSKRSTGQIIVADSGTSITEGLEGTVFGTQGSSERYYVHEISVKESSDQVVLGTLRDSGKIGFAMKDMGDWTSIYCAAPHLSANLYRNILEMAEAHIYSDNPADIIWSNSGYVGVHSATTGTKTIKLPSNYAVYDVFEEKFISMDTDTIKYENKLNDTHLFRLTPANTYSFLAYVKGGNGKLSETGLFHMKQGESKSIVITPNEGYMIKSITMNGEEIEVGADHTVTVANIDKNHTLVAKFKRVPTNRTLDEDDNKKGSIINTPKEEAMGEDGKEVAKDTYQEIWATIRDIISIPWWLLLLWGIGIGGVIFAIRFLIIKWKEKRNEK